MSGFENNTGLGVSAFYGPMSQREGTDGHRRTEGTTQEINLHVSPRAIATGAFDRDLAFIAEAGKPFKVAVRVVEAFAVADTGSIDIGTSGSEGTNGFSIPEADAEAEGVYVYETFNGTWDGALPDTAFIGVDGSDVEGDEGFAVVTVYYYQVH